MKTVEDILDQHDCDHQDRRSYSVLSTKSAMKEYADQFRISKELFVETIDQIEKQYQRDLKCSEAFKVILPNDYVTGYDNHHLFNQTIKILQVLMNDDNANSWIEYFMFDLEFGKRTDLSASREDGSTIDISDAGKLYDLLKETT